MNTLKSFEAGIPAPLKPISSFRKSSRFEIIILALSLSFAATCTAALPDLQNVAKPSPEPDAPSGWDVFTPPVNVVSPPTGSPTIAEWTRTGVSDDTLILTGDKLSSFVGSDKEKTLNFSFMGKRVTAIQSNRRHRSSGLTD